MSRSVYRNMMGVLIVLFSIGTFVLGVAFFRSSPSVSLVVPVYAEDDEEDEEEDDDEEDDDEDDDEEEQEESGNGKSTPTYKTIFVTKIITLLDPKYTIDQDGDLLVDGIDPHPTVHEREYFTDDDDDGVPNMFDRYPHDDDFSYYEGESDDDENGIIDSYESVDER